MLLGPINDVMDKLEQLYPCEMADEFYAKNHLKKSGEGPGGKFNGPSVKLIMKESSLQQLEEVLPVYSIACEFTDYLRTLRFVHEICVSRTFDKTSFHEILLVFGHQFQILKENMLSMRH